jgi:hypothetical protein
VLTEALPSVMEVTVLRLCASGPKGRLRRFPLFIRVLVDAPTLMTQVSRFVDGITGSALGGHGSVTGVALNAFDEDERERDRFRDQLVQ